MRSVLIHHSSGAILASVAAGAELDLFEKRAYEYGLMKASKPAVKTRVGRYVERRTPTVSRKAAKVLHAAGKKVATQIASLYEKKLAKTEDTDAIIQAILDELDLQDVSVEVVDAITPDLLRAFKEAGILGVGQVGVNTEGDITDHVDAKAVEYAAQRGGELIKDLAGTTRDDLQTLLEQAVEDGMSAGALSDSVEELGAFGEARADMIARTELAYAHVQGNVEGWRATGQVSMKESVLGDLHDVDDVCDECASVGPVELDAEFVPGYDFPPYHPNCICDILPVLSDQGDENVDTEQE